MAVFGGYPQNVTFSTVNVAKGGGSENLLINPRGKINQLNETDGVLSVGVYFCDGWKAGASGAEVYRDTDGFRLISGSIVQLVPNNLGAGRNLRANMDVISGAPSISINGGSDNAVSGVEAYIEVEISGDNSKFTRVILAESLEIPVYQQVQDELPMCKRFLMVANDIKVLSSLSTYPYATYLFDEMIQVPAVNVGALYDSSVFNQITKSSVLFSSGQNKIAGFTGGIVLDARP